MSKLKILVAGLVPDEGLVELKRDFAVDHQPDASRAWILKHLGEYDGLLLASTRADRELIDAGKKLKIITTFGVGYDHVDVDYARECGIVVTNCPISVRIPTAEMALTLMLATVRRLHFYDHAMRQGSGSTSPGQSTWGPVCRVRLSASTVWGGSGRQLPASAGCWGCG